LSEEAVAAPSRGGAPAYDADSINYEPPATSRRGGFAMALSAGAGLGVYQGYELSVDALNDPNARQSTGATMGTLMSLWLGGSPRDWLTLGLGLASLNAQGAGVMGAGGALIAHVEGYPLFSLGSQFENLGIGLSGGIGMMNIVDEEERDFEDPLASSGSLSLVQVETFWEPWRFWHVSMGPALNYTHGFSQSMNVNQLTLVFRTALYGVQPKKRKPE
jgi:hypothetical protein